MLNSKKISDKQIREESAFDLSSSNIESAPPIPQKSDFIREKIRLISNEMRKNTKGVKKEVVKIAECTKSQEQVREEIDSKLPSSSMESAPPVPKKGWKTVISIVNRLFEEAEKATKIEEAAKAKQQVRKETVSDLPSINMESAPPIPQKSDFIREKISSEDMRKVIEKGMKADSKRVEPTNKKIKPFGTSEKQENKQEEETCHERRKSSIISRSS